MATMQHPPQAGPAPVTLVAPPPEPPEPPKPVKAAAAVKKPPVEKPPMANPVLPVRPIAGAAADAVAIVTATAVYTGTAPVLAAGAAVLAAGTAAAAGHQMRRNKASSGSVWRSTPSSGGATGRLGRSGTGGGRSSGAGAGSVGLPGSGRRGAQTRRMARKVAALGAGGGRSGSGAAGGGPGAGKGSGPGGSGASRRGLLGARPAGGGPGGGANGSRSRNGGRPGTTSGTGPHPVPAKSRKSAAGKGASGKGATTGGGGSKLSDPAWVAAQRKKAERRARTRKQQQERQRRAQERQQRQGKKSPGTDTATGRSPIPEKQPRRPRYGNRARRGATTTPQDQARVRPQPPYRRPIPAGDNTTDRQLVGAAASGGIHMASGVRALIEATNQVAKMAGRYNPPEGVVELIDVEYVLLAELLEAQVAVWQAFHKRATDPIEGVPMPPGVMNALDAIAKVQMKTAATVQTIPALARKVCADRLALLDDPKQAMFDLRANRGGSGRAAA